MVRALLQRILHLIPQHGLHGELGERAAVGLCGGTGRQDRFAPVGTLVDH